MVNPPYALLPKPGTYHIANLATGGSVIEVPPYNQSRVVGCGNGGWASKPHQKVHFYAYFWL